METLNKTKITVETLVNSTMEKVWNYWTGAQHIMQWNNASADWHTPHAENDLRIGGKFLFRMAAKDGSMSFDLVGTYEEVEPNKKIAYTLEDARKVEVIFSISGNEIKVSETFEAESENSIELQKDGWQAILDNFKKYTEEN